MGKYTIKDFSVGDQVYHLSNRSLIMVVIEKNIELNEILCRWLDKSGNVQSIPFKAEELGKSNDLAPRMFSI